METIPTAEQFLYAKLMLSNQPYLKRKQYEQAMIDFAKLHVTEALKLASYNVDLCIKDRSKYPEDGYSVDTTPVENCYPLTNIK